MVMVHRNKVRIGAYTNQKRANVGATLAIANVSNRILDSPQF
jgi:hypothetical protein